MEFLSSVDLNLYHSSGYKDITWTFAYKISIKSQRHFLIRYSICVHLEM